MALLDRVLQRGPRTTLPVEEQRMSLIEHLEALRRALIICLIAWSAATIAAIFVAGHVITFLITRAGIGHAIYLQPGGGVLLQLKVALYIGIVLAAPVIIQQVWWFVSPGLHPHERKYVLPLVLATILFFAIGVSVAMFALPLYIKILGSLAPADVTYLPDISELVSFVLIMVIGFGLVFELPVVLFVLGMLRIINSRWLNKRRPYWFLGLALLANFLTPGVDPLTPMIMFVPLYLFFEGTALLLKLLGR
ncbi:MAG: twin-arginine translocase subunit TatC [Chloroflexi bacterium]|nr:MAG: twin-arginine translocase subunit TatC [Chloroflexota bacterium]TME37093.1 MAG: twin-arginine translocase subunit TatC [Chloroflexota bacterium]TME50760.1 MAG: twin-arginine translocase subunit TatC [Chloroflexota bacterium]